MQKLLAFIACFFISYFSYSQNNSGHLVNAYILKGSYMIGGGISSSFNGYTYQTPNQSADKGSILRVNTDLKVGYFNWEDIGIGLKANLSYYNRQSDSTSNDLRQTILLVGPFVRGYLDNGIFGEISGGWGANNIFRISQSNLFRGEAGVGYTYFLGDIGRQNYWLRNKQIAIEPMLLFRYDRQNFGAKKNSDNYRSEYGPEIRLSVQVFFLRQTMMLPNPIRGRRPD
ncbi:hypothetical protein AAE02nite_49850 [Adhaeribacter aerolatus]|uniref:Outer membrane protein beta-barrel domain-containing protein n=1 Tax=Adhaeribacter aerolatus TaxID=670289 RepID=A0A512B5V3_9BACT|nr:hypothetical protein [Adhaeribacter aerolatus]GEO07321.1 hypothetical protein AAE02nite_49850 [Adhaeribacter aerolatus]